jgi:hypothetical protein
MQIGEYVFSCVIVRLRHKLLSMKNNVHGVDVDNMEFLYGFFVVLH